MGSYNRHRTAHKADFLLTPALTRQKPQGAVMEGQHKPVRGGKQGMEGKRGAQRAGERKEWGRQVCKGVPRAAQESAGQPGHLRGRSGLRRQNTPSFEIISRNLQT